MAIGTQQTRATQGVNTHRLPKWAGMTEIYAAQLAFTASADEMPCTNTIPTSLKPSGTHAEIAIPSPPDSGPNFNFNGSP